MGRGVDRIQSWNRHEFSEGFSMRKMKATISYFGNAKSGRFCLEIVYTIDK